jgi:hypothetical protein
LTHTVGLLWTSDQPVAEASTYTEQHNIETQETNIHAFSGIRTRYPSNQTAANLRFRPRGYRVRQDIVYAGDVIRREKACVTIRVICSFLLLLLLLLLEWQMGQFKLCRDTKYIILLRIKLSVGQHAVNKPLGMGIEIHASVLLFLTVVPESNYIFIYFKNH